MDENEKISRALFAMLPPDQINRVMGQKWQDISPEFLGFVDIYKALSEIIPKHFTIVDLGCAANAQCFLFQEHKKYIAVDNFPCTEKFISSNCVIYEMSIKCFIKIYVKDLFLPETFAICSYVPPWGGDNMKMVRDNFRNVFTYYPHGGNPKFFKQGTKI